MDKGTGELVKKVDFLAKTFRNWGYEFPLRMSLWRAKKRYEANQGLNELADNALLAISLLRNESEDWGAYSMSEVEEYLREGVQLLEVLYRSIDSPEEVEDYKVVLADYLRKSQQMQTEIQFEEDLRSWIDVLYSTSEDLEWRSELNEIENLFRRIEDFTSETSARNLDDVKNHLAVGNR